MSFTFSERYGHKVKREFLQVNSIDACLRTGLWNVFYEVLWEKLPKEYNNRVRPHYYNLSAGSKEFFKDLQVTFFSKPLDEIHYRVKESLASVKDFFFKSEWYEVYDFLEFVSNSTYIPKQLAIKDFTDKLNEILEKHLSAYRFRNGYFVSITDKNELESIETALSSGFKYAAQHLESSLQQFSNREQPDYRNSIKESISAVESICRELTKESTLDKALKKIQSKIEMNDQFKQGLEKLYHYTNGTDGIRHAIMDDSKVASDEAKFMLVTCSAFVNYLTAKSAKIKS